MLLKYTLNVSLSSIRLKKMVPYELLNFKCLKSNRISENSIKY